MQLTASEYSPHAFVSNHRGRESMQSDALHEQGHETLLAAPALSSAPEGLMSPDEEQQNPGNSTELPSRTTVAFYQILTLV